jgi:hypothetical protein
VPPDCATLLLQTLAYNAGMFSRAQAMRREGTAPAAMGVADDLPTRMAYQQLHILAGMAGKVRAPAEEENWGGGPSCLHALTT